MLRKVITPIALSPSLKALAKIASGKFLCIMLTFVMLMMGCAPREISASVNSTPTVEPIEHGASTGEDAPEIVGETPIPILTPKTTETPAPSNDYYLFFPTEEELKKLEQASNDLEKRLLKITDGTRCALPSTDYTTFQIMRFLSGDFEEVYQKREDADFKETSLGLVVNILAGFNVTMSYITDNINGKGNSEVSKSNIFSPEFYKIFEVAGLDKYEGAETLKIFEIESDSLYRAGLKGNTKDFINKSKVIAELIEKILSKAEVQYKEQKLTSLYNMHPLVKLVVLELMLNTSQYIGFITGNYDLKVNDKPDSYNLYYYVKIIKKLRIQNEVKQEVLNLIDAYLEIREQDLHEAY